MDHSKTIQTRRLSLTDASINGLIGGILAGIGMLAWLLIAGLQAGGNLLAILESFYFPGQQPNAVSGVFLHLGISAVYGAIFGALLQLLPRPARKPAGRLIVGLGYGLLLYLLAQAIILPVTASPLAELSSLALISSHLVFGAVLGALTRA